MIHILAVSGLHVGIVMLLLQQLTYVLRNSKFKMLRLLLIVSGIWSFAILTGASPSVLRAATMFSFLQLGNSLGKKNQSTTAVLFSAMLLLLTDPMMLYQIGFQMSYLAVIAILWIQPWLSHFIYPKYYLTKLIWGIITVSISAQLGVLPLSLYYFHQFPSLFLISNTVVLPFLGTLLIGGIVIVGLSVVDILPEWLVIAYGKSIDTLNMFIRWIAEKESFIYMHITISGLALVAFYALIITSILFFKKSNTWRLVLLLMCIIINTAIYHYDHTYDRVSH